MKATFLGEPGGSDTIVVTHPLTGSGHTLKVGKATEVPAGTIALGNPFFKLEGAEEQKPADPKQQEIAACKSDILKTQQQLDDARADVKNAKNDDERQAAQERVDDRSRALTTLGKRLVELV